MLSNRLTHSKQITPTFFADIFIPDAKRGFLPVKSPLTALPNNCDIHIELNRIAHNLPLLLKTNTLRDEIDALNKKYSDASLKLQINNKQEKDIAILTLTMLTQAYIWQTPNQPNNLIPAVISKNLEMLCQPHPKRFPILTYSDYVLNNWKLIDPNIGFTLENIEPIFTFTGVRDEAWFIKIHLAIEAASGAALRSVYEICCFNNTEDQIIRLLNIVSESLKKATTILLRMKEHCNPEFFYQTLRPFLTGWDKKLGIRFEGNESIRQYKGPSGAQSSILPVLDEALGVKHEKDEMYEHLLLFKQYMPHKHSSFINFIQTRAIPLGENSSERLIESLNNAIKGVQDFRFMHRYAMVGRYIEKQVIKNAEPGKSTGTGGTTIDYLEKRHKNSMRRSRL